MYLSIVCFTWAINRCISVFCHPFLYLRKQTHNEYAWHMYCIYNDTQYVPFVKHMFEVYIVPVCLVKRRVWSCREDKGAPARQILRRIINNKASVVEERSGQIMQDPSEKYKKEYERWRERERKREGERERERERASMLHVAEHGVQVWCLDCGNVRQNIKTITLR